MLYILWFEIYYSQFPDYSSQFGIFCLRIARLYLAVQTSEFITHKKEKNAELWDINLQFIKVIATLYLRQTHNLTFFEEKKLQFRHFEEKKSGRNVR